MYNRVFRLDDVSLKVFSWFNFLNAIFMVFFTGSHLKAATEVKFGTADSAEMVSIPHIWVQTDKWKSLGEGLYRIKVSDPLLFNRPLALFINRKHTQNITPFEVFLSGRLIYRYGNVDERDNLHQLILPKENIMVPAQVKPFTIEVKIYKNTSTLWPGLHNFKIIPQAEAQEHFFQNSLISSFMIGSLVVVSFYHLILWLLNPSQKYHLVFVVLCCTVAVFVLLHVSKVLFKYVSVSSYQFLVASF